MDFTSLEQLSKYLSSQAGQSIMTTSGLTIQQILEQEARRLLNFIQKRINEYYESYQPVMYERTYGLFAMRIEDFTDMSVINGTASIKINFDELEIQAHSIFGDDSTAYNTVELINNGWQVRDGLWFSNVEHLGFQKPARFIENGIVDFNADNPYNLKIELQGFHS